MRQDTINTLNEFKESLLRELNEYCKIVSKTADVQLKYEKKHPDEAHCLPASMMYLGQYYGYNGARDVVNEVFEEFMNRPEKISEDELLHMASSIK